MSQPEHKVNSVGAALLVFLGLLPLGFGACGAMCGNPDEPPTERYQQTVMPDVYDEEGSPAAGNGDAIPAENGG